MTRLHRDGDSSPLAGSSEVATSSELAGRSEWFPLLLVSSGVPGCHVILEGTRDPVSLFFGATVSVHVSGWPFLSRTLSRGTGLLSSSALLGDS